MILRHSFYSKLKNLFLQAFPQTSIRILRRKYLVLALTGIGMLLGYQNCAPVVYRDVSPYTIKQGVLGSGQGIVSAAMNKTVDGYTVSMSAGHVVNGVEKQVDGYKFHISIQGEMNAVAWETKVMTRQ